MKFTDSEIDSLRKILRGVHLSDYGSRIVDDARTILGKLPKSCQRCGRRQSKSAGCPDVCHVQTAADVLMGIFGLERVADRDLAEYIATRAPVRRVCEHCHGRKCKAECIAVATMDAAVRGKR